MINFDPTDLIFVRKKVRDIDIADPELLNPRSTTVTPLIDGEFIRMDDTGNAVRAYDDGDDDFESQVPAWPVFAEQGRYDTRRSKQVPVIWDHDYEVEITSNLYETDGTGFTMGQALTVGTVNKGGVKRAAFKPVDHGTAGSRGMVHAFVTQLPTAANEKMKVYMVSPKPSQSL